jgi:hypothetical protein
MGKVCHTASLTFTTLNGVKITANPWGFLAPATILTGTPDSILPFEE